MDGGWNLDAGSNNSVFNEVGIDFIQEVDVQSSNYDAEFGRSASATVNVVTKSGGDHYHGGLFEFVQNNIFNAANAGTKLTFVPSARCRPYRVQCGAPISFERLWMGFGRPHPVSPRKASCFSLPARSGRGSEGPPQDCRRSTETQTFPTAAEAAGNFTDVLTGTTPLRAQNAGGNPRELRRYSIYRAQRYKSRMYHRRRRSHSQLYTTAAKLSTLGGLPTAAAANNLAFNLPNPANIREDIIRVDEHLNDKQSIYFRYLHDNVLITNPYSTFGATPEVPVDPDQRDRPGYNIQIGWTSVISQTLINEFKFNADWHKQRTPHRRHCYG